MAAALRHCIYAGSFDPVTEGHMYMIREGAKLFDRFIIAVGDNPEKTSTFTLEERLDMLRSVTSRIKNVEVDHFSYQYLVNYAKSITTVFLMPPREISEISSSFVRGLVGPRNWEKVVKEYLPGPVYKVFLRHFQK